MIQSIPNPTMTQDEIRQFRLEMLRRMKGNFTEEERRAAQKRKRRMEEVANRIMKNNGGKNPILGYLPVSGN